MGLFDKITKIIDSVEKMEKVVENTAGNRNMGAQNMDTQEEIKLLPSSHMVEEEEYGDGDDKYRISFQVNDAFKEAKSHAGEVSMLNTYAPEEEYGEEGKIPCVAIMMDDDVYCPVAEFKERGTFDGAIELTPLSGKFYFKAKKEYFGDMMYFYGLDRCDGFWENNGLCIVYPKAYVGTENETKMMRILDEVAGSYCEEKME